MTESEQLDWVDAHEVRDPRWADTEFTIRRKALELQEQVLREGTVTVELAVLDGRNSYGVRRIRFQRMPFAQIGGMEQILLIEHVLREALSP